MISQPGYPSPSFIANSVSSSFAAYSISPSILSVVSKNLTINIPNVKPVDGFTFDFWMITPIPIGEQIIIDQDCPNPFKMTIKFTGLTKIVWYYSLAGSISETFLGSIWQRITASASPSEFRASLWIDKSGSDSYSNQINFCSGTIIKINPTSLLDAKMTDFKIWSRGLTQKEVDYYFNK